MFNQTFEKNIEEILFKTNHTKEIQLDTKKVIFLDNYSTMYLLWKSDLVEKITKTEKNMTVQVNGVTLLVTHKAKIKNIKDGKTPE